MNKLKFICISVALLLIAGCSNDINTMLDNYNENYTVVEAESTKAPVPGDANFDPSTMLQETYCVASDETVNLAAPYKCNSYKWVVTDPSENGKEVTVLYFDGLYECTQRLFVTYIPESGLKAGNTYVITLTVTDKEGAAYTDTCELVIYNHVL